MKVSENPKCTGCPLLKVDFTYEKGGKRIRHVHADQNFVPPQVGPSLRILIGEAAGETENLEMKPFVGAAGKFLDSLLRKAGIERDSLTILNVLQCRPPNNKFPGDPESRGYITEQEAKKVVCHCYTQHIKPLLISRPWTRVDLIGGHALRLFTGKGDLLTWRGSPLEIDTDEIDKRLHVG